MFHSSGNSYLAINVAGFALDAEDGKNPGFSSKLCPPSTIKPPKSCAKVPIPEVPPLPTIVLNSLLENLSPAVSVIK